MNIFKEACDYLSKEPNRQNIDMSLKNTHVKGMYSIVLNIDNDGNLFRVFYATEEIKPYEIALHEHRYSLTLGFIDGCVKQHSLIETSLIETYGETGETYICERISLPVFKYDTPLNGGNGLTYIEDIFAYIISTDMPLYSSVYLNADDIHTISCTKSSMWIVREENLGYNKNYSYVYGKPFTTDGLYDKISDEEYNNIFNLIKDKLKPYLNCINNTN